MANTPRPSVSVSVLDLQSNPMLSAPGIRSRSRRRPRQSLAQLAVVNSATAAVAAAAAAVTPGASQSSAQSSAQTAGVSAGASAGTGAPHGTPGTPHSAPGAHVARRRAHAVATAAAASRPHSAKSSRRRRFTVSGSSLATFQKKMGLTGASGQPDAIHEAARRAAKQRDVMMKLAEAKAARRMVANLELQRLVRPLRAKRLNMKQALYVSCCSYASKWGLWMLLCITALSFSPPPPPCAPLRAFGRRYALERQKRNRFYVELLRYVIFLVVFAWAVLSLPVHYPFEQVGHTHLCIAELSLGSLAWAGMQRRVKRSATFSLMKSFRVSRSRRTLSMFGSRRNCGSGLKGRC